jgi:hypothetical protein
MRACARAAIAAFVIAVLAQAGGFGPVPGTAFAADHMAPDGGLHEAGFADPPRSARPRAFWNWLNGNVSLPVLTRDLKEMKAKGMGGAEMWDSGALRNPDNFIPAGPPFLGPESVAAMHHALREGKRLDLVMGLFSSSGWNAGGPWVTPEHASKNIYVTATAVEGPARVEQPLAFPEVPAHCPKGPDGLPIYYRDVAILAVPDTPEKVIARVEEMRDSGDFQDRVLRWDAPSGLLGPVRLVPSAVVRVDL